MDNAKKQSITFTYKIRSAIGMQYENRLQSILCCCRLLKDVALLKKCRKLKRRRNNACNARKSLLNIMLVNISCHGIIQLPYNYIQDTIRYTLSNTEPTNSHNITFHISSMCPVFFVHPSGNPIYYNSIIYLLLILFTLY